MARAGWILAVVVALPAGSLLWAAGADPDSTFGAQSRVCGVRGAHVAFTGLQAVVASKPRYKPGPEWAGLADAQWVGCVKGSQSGVELGGLAYSRKFHIRGHRVAYYTRDIDDGAAGYGISEVRVADLRRRSDMRIGSPYPDSDGTVKQFALRRDGSVAWIGCPFDYRFRRSTYSDPYYCAPARKRPIYVVITSSSRLRYDKYGYAYRQTGIVDRGARINPRSLRLVPGGVTWLNNGRRKYAGFFGG